MYSLKDFNVTFGSHDIFISLVLEKISSYIEYRFSLSLFSSSELFDFLQAVLKQGQYNIGILVVNKDAVMLRTEDLSVTFTVGKVCNEKIQIAANNLSKRTVK